PSRTGLDDPRHLMYRGGTSSAVVRPVPAATRRAKAQDVTGGHATGDLVGQRGGRRLVAAWQQPVLADGARTAAVEPPRGADPPLRDQRQRDVLEHLHVPLDAVAAAPPALTPPSG